MPPTDRAPVPLTLTETIAMLNAAASAVLAMSLHGTAPGAPGAPRDRVTAERHPGEDV